MTDTRSIDRADTPTRRGPKPTQDAGHCADDTWLWLSGPIALLGAIAAGSGILFDSTYERDFDNFATQEVSQDLGLLRTMLRATSH